MRDCNEQFNNVFRSGDGGTEGLKGKECVAEDIRNKSSQSKVEGQKFILAFVKGYIVSTPP